MLKNRLSILIVSLLLLALASCGRGRNNEDDLLTSVLTVAAPPGFERLIHAAGELLRADLLYDGIDLQIIHEIEGTDADIFLVRPEHPMRGLIEGGYLADINRLIDTYASRDYFFTNVLDALEINGGLYTFPLNFAFEYVGINAGIPPEFIEGFSENETITVEQLIALYNDFQLAGGDLAFGYGPSPVADTIRNWISEGINWSSGTFALPDEQAFSLLLPFTEWSIETRNEIVRIGVTNPLGVDILSFLQERYVFKFAVIGLDAATALLEFQNPRFVHGIPVTTEDGRLLAARATNYLFAVSAEAAYSDGELVMAYLRHLVSAWVESMAGEISLATPIERALFRDHAEAGFTRAMFEPGTQTAVSSAGDAIARLENYLQMPVAVPTSIFMLPPDFTFENIQTQVSSWLEEGETIIRESPPAPDEARDHLPYQVLTVLANHRYLFVMEQAADSINRDWAERGKNYNFRLDISTFGYDDEATTFARLGTMLMAGQGYDLVTIYESRNPSISFPIWNWGNSGLLADIWQLIDEHPATERNDFYTNVLEAFEAFGGLWAFPTNFGFEYIGVNTSLPESIIDRFSQYSTIRVSELMGLYLDLIENYGDEFGHMRINAGPLNDPAAVLMHTVSGFICTNSRVSNLDSQEFLDFLRLMDRVYTGIEYPPVWGFPSNWDEDWHDYIVNQYAFTVYTHEYDAAYALLPTVHDWHTAHHIPLADESGNLRINPVNWVHNTWATLLYPALGNELLAWEFTQHLLEAFVNPSRRAHNLPVHAVPGGWGRVAVSTPILRRYFEHQIARGVEYAVEREEGRLRWGWFRPFQEHMFTDEGREEETVRAIERLAAYNEMPISIPPFIPAGLRDALVETLDQFLRGLLTPEVAAQRMHDRVQLWLIE